MSCHIMAAMAVRRKQKKPRFLSWRKVIDAWCKPLPQHSRQHVLIGRVTGSWQENHMLGKFKLRKYRRISVP